MHETCAACGFDGACYDDPGLLDALRSLGARWRTLLDGAGDLLRRRPAPTTWSAIEYAAHSRDITALHVFGVEQALTADEPAFPAIGDDLIEVAAAEYATADVRTVTDGLAAEADRLAQLAGDGGFDVWDRGITIGGSRLDVRRLLEHALHDSLHHLDDVERGFSQART